MKYSKEMLEDAVKNSFSFAGVLRHLGIRQAGGSQSYITKRVRDYGMDTSHFTGAAHNKGTKSPRRKTPDEILVVLPEGSYRAKTHQLRRAMIESGVPYECGMNRCLSPEPVWRGRPLVLEVDHLDCDWLNNLLENLRFACPNCHSQEEC